MERELIRKAGRIGMELIPDTASDLWCYRPVILDEEGRETVRYKPDPCEFKYTEAQVRVILRVNPSFQ
jgi:hypothetical protein